MALISRRAQQVTMAGRTWSFAVDEALITEYSYKYTAPAFIALAAGAGWRAVDRWHDPSEDLSLHLLVQADSKSDAGKLHEPGGTAPCDAPGAGRVDRRARGGVPRGF